MRQFENEVCECEHYSPSDSESGMQPKYREPCTSIDIPRHSPQNHCMQPPLAGLIYVCDSRTRRLILKRKFIIYMPARKKWVDAARLRPGAKLFIFDCEDRLLWGTYEITTFPHFLRRRGDDSPYQIYFQLYQMCKPLEEEVFRHAITENYYTSRNFRFELSGDQVTNLLSLLHFHTNYWRGTQQVIRQRIRPEQRRFQEVNKFPAFGDEAVSSGMRRSACRKRNRKRKHQAQLDNPQAKAEVQLMAESNRTRSTSPIPEKKSFLLKDDLMQCALKLGRAESFLMDSSPACFQDSLAEVDDDSSKDAHDKSIEDGEFVLPEGKDTSFKNRQYQKLQLNDTISVEELDGDSDAELQTRNFIEILEHRPTSNLNTNTSVEDNEACERAVWIQNKVQGVLARTLGKGKRTPSAPYLSSTDGGNEVKRSVWLRLSDPRPMKTDHFFADEYVFKPKKSQQCGACKERQSCLQSFDGGYYSSS